MTTIQEEDAITLRAIKEALRKFDSPLSEELAQQLLKQINQVIQDLEENTSEADEPTSLYDFVDELEENPEYELLFKLYQKERVSLQQQYSQQERGKAIQKNSPLLPFAPSENVAGDINYLKTYQPPVASHQANPNADIQNSMSETEIRGRNF